MCALMSLNVVYTLSKDSFYKSVLSAVFVSTTKSVDWFNSEYDPPLQSLYFLKRRAL